MENTDIKTCKAGNAEKIYLADINNAIISKFNNAVLRYEDAEDKYEFITKGSKYISVGTGDEIFNFDNWDGAVEYGNSLKTEYYVGIRPRGKRNSVICAIVPAKVSEFNGFANEAQYKAVMDVLMENCDADTIMANYDQDHDMLEVVLDDNIYHCYGGALDSVEVPAAMLYSYEVEQIHSLINCLDDVWFAIEDNEEVESTEEAFTEKEYNETHKTEKWTDFTFAVASRIAKHFNDINLMDGLDITYDDEDDTIWVNNYQLFRSGRIRYWGDEDAEWPDLEEYLAKQPSYWFDFLNAYYDSDKI